MGVWLCVISPTIGWGMDSKRTNDGVRTRVTSKLCLCAVKQRCISSMSNGQEKARRFEDNRENLAEQRCSHCKNFWSGFRFIWRFKWHQLSELYLDSAVLPDMGAMSRGGCHGPHDLTLCHWLRI